jgi:hypothetical protein
MIWPFATAVAIACEQQGRLAANTGLAACVFARASATAAAGEAAAAAGQVVTLHRYRTGTARLDRGLGFGELHAPDGSPRRARRGRFCPFPAASRQSARLPFPHGSSSRSTTAARAVGSGSDTQAACDRRCPDERPRVRRVHHADTVTTALRWFARGTSAQRRRHTLGAVSAERSCCLTVSNSVARARRSASALRPLSAHSRTPAANRWNCL